jgi:hypothetical protein
MAAAALALGGVALRQANRAAADHGRGRAAELESDRAADQARRRTLPIRGGDPSMS